MQNMTSLKTEIIALKDNIIVSIVNHLPGLQVPLCLATLSTPLRAVYIILLLYKKDAENFTFSDHELKPEKSFSRTTQRSSRL